MFIKFIKLSFVFTISNILFSAFRQLYFLPFLSEFEADLFVIVAMTIFLVESVQYAIAGSLSDFYVKNCKGYNLEVLKKLAHYSIVATVFIPLFLVYDFTIEQAFVLGGYLVLSSLNTLWNKPLFNALYLNFNIVYLLFRLFPYILVTTKIAMGGALTINYFIYTLFFSELMYLMLLKWFVYRPEQKWFTRLTVTRMNETGPTPSLLKGVALFFIAYLLMGVVQRYELYLVEYFYTDELAYFIKVFAIIGFFCNPISAFFSSALLSFFNNRDLSINQSVQMLFIPILILCMIIFITSYYTLNKLMLFLYSIEIMDIMLFVSLIIPLNFMYLVLRAVCVKFSDTKNIIKCNCIVLLLPLLFYYFLSELSFIEMVLMYCSVRVFTYVSLLLYSMKNQIKEVI